MNCNTAATAVLIVALITASTPFPAGADQASPAVHPVAAPGHAGRAAVTRHPHERAPRDWERYAPTGEFEIKSGPLTGRRLLRLDARGNAHLSAIQRDLRRFPDPHAAIGFSRLNALPSIRAIASNLQTLAQRDVDVEVRAETIRSLKTGATDLNIRVLVKNGPSALLRLPAGASRARVTLIPGPHGWAAAALPSSSKGPSGSDLTASARLFLALADPLTGFFLLVAPARTTAPL